MKDINNIKAMLTGEIHHDIEILVNECEKLTFTKSGMESLYEISSLIIDICINNDFNEKEKIIKNAQQNQKRYLTFLLKEIEKQLNKRQWKDAKLLINEAIDKFSLIPIENPKFISFQFTSLQEAYLYAAMNKEQNIT